MQLFPSLLPLVLRKASPQNLTLRINLKLSAWLYISIIIHRFPALRQIKKEILLWESCIKSEKKKGKFGRLTVKEKSNFQMSKSNNEENWYVRLIDENWIPLSARENNAKVSFENEVFFWGFCVNEINILLIAHICLMKF